MVYVYGSIKVKKGKVQEFIKTFNAFAIEVRKEPGCIEYLPAIDIQPAIPGQLVDENAVSIIERWKDMKSLQVHVSTPAFQKEMEREKDMVEGVTLKIMQEA